MFLKLKEVLPSYESFDQDEFNIRQSREFRHGGFNEVYEELKRLADLPERN